MMIPIVQCDYTISGIKYPSCRYSHDFRYEVSLLSPPSPVWSIPPVTAPTISGIKYPSCHRSHHLRYEVSLLSPLPPSPVWSIPPVTAPTISGMKYPSCHRYHHLRYKVSLLSPLPPSPVWSIPTVIAPTISGMKYPYCHRPAIADLEINEIQNKYRNQFYKWGSRGSTMSNVLQDMQFRQNTSD